MNNTRVSVYVRNETLNPSDYYVVYQFVSKVSSIDIKIRRSCSNLEYNIYMLPFFRSKIGTIIRRPVQYISIVGRSLYSLMNDLLIFKPEKVIISREVFPVVYPWPFSLLYEKLLKRSNVVWCFDDRIDLGEVSRKEWEILCREANEILVTHRDLAATLGKDLQGKVGHFPQADGYLREKAILNASIDERRFSYNYEVRLIWVGTSSNLTNLYSISEELEKAAEIINKLAGKNLVLTVVCNKKYSGTHINLLVNNVRWSERMAMNEMASSHIGIMPLIENEYNKGKGGFKLVQYLTMGLPVVATDIGHNRRIVGSEVGVLISSIQQELTWADAIIDMALEYEEWRKKSMNAFIYVEENFSFIKGVNFWKEILNK